MPAQTTRTLVEVKEYLDSLLQVAGLDEARNGLVLGGWPAVDKVGLAVNCSFQAIEEASERGCELLITHHAAGRSTDAHLAEQKHDRLEQLGINLYVAHDCLDQAPNLGTGWALARAVRVAVQGSFKPDGERAFGVHGISTGRLTEFVVRVGNQLGTEPSSWRNTDGFAHVGIVTGFGAQPEWMARAQSLGCDTFLTGEADMFGMLFAKEAGMNLITCGHYASKTPGMMGLSARIAQDLQIDVTFIPEDIVEARG
jgi:putative NIF3 family GTP cyclohydrolase 1 type 2